MPRKVLVSTAFVKDGLLFIPRRKAFDADVKTWPNCQTLLRLEEHKDPRSAALNAYYWGVCIDLVSEETGMFPEEAHEEMKRLHLPKALVAQRGNGRIHNLKVFDGTTTDLSHEEEWRYIENIQMWAAMKLDCVIPDPVHV